MSAPRVGICGLGFMGQTHLAAYRAAAQAGQANRLVAVCDARPERRAGRLDTVGNLVNAGSGAAFDPAEVRAYERAEELFADPEVDVVSLCTPTDTHVDLAVAALAAGKHVLVEKPISLSVEDAERLAAAAREAGTICMPAMCMRFWPGWDWLRARVVAGTFGPVRSAVFRRLGSPPSWGQAFYRDTARSGGALFDLHVHDADFVRWCFGAPAAVSSTGSVDHVTTLYRYPDGPEHVVAEGGWNHTPGFPFHMGFTVVFEEATAAFGADPERPLLLARDGAAEAVPLEPGTGYDGEVRHFLRAAAGEEPLAATADEAAALVAMLAAERRSVERGEPVRL